MGAHKKYTDEERQQKKKENYLLRQKPKEAADWKRLESVRINENRKLNKKESKKFKAEIKEVSRKRFDEIFNNEKIWEEINSSSDIWMIKKERQDRRRRSGNGKWIKDKEVERAEQVIYGGRDLKIWEDDEEIEDKPFVNPYKQNEENE